MAMRVSMNIGFVTNSSSVVYHFPASVLEDPRVKALLEAFEVGEGYVGPNLWHRGQCDSVAISKEKKQEVRAALNEIDYDDARRPEINVDSDEVVVVIGDEYEALANTIADFMKQALGKEYYGEDYN